MSLWSWISHRRCDPVCKKSQRIYKNYYNKHISKVTVYKLNIQTLIIFVYTNNKQLELEIKETIAFVIAVQK